MGIPRIPGIVNNTGSSHRNVLIGSKGAMYLPGGGVIDGSESADPGNSESVRILRAGLLLGKITSTHLWAPSIIGVTGEALDGDETALTVAAGVVTELVRRVGASGTFSMIGPPTAAGTVRQSQITYSAASGTTITMVAIEAASTWTLTEAAGTDAGTFAIRVTNPDGDSETTAALAFNVSAADMELAVEALTIVGAGNGTCAGNAGGPYTITFEPNLGNMIVEVVNDGTIDNPLSEGGIVVAQTVVGVDGRWIAGSLICPEDGSQQPRAILGDGYGVKVVDEDANDIDVPVPNLLIGGYVDTDMIPNWSSDTTLAAYMRALILVAGPFIFSDVVGKDSP